MLLQRQLQMIKMAIYMRSLWQSSVLQAPTALPHHGSIPVIQSTHPIHALKLVGPVAACQTSRLM